MKFTIGTASSNLDFAEDMKLIKSSLLYADEIELIGMAEYAIYNYLPRCIAKANDIDGIISAFIPFLRAFDNKEANELAEQLKSLGQQISPYKPYLKKRKKRSRQEILAQIKVEQVEKQCKETFDVMLDCLMEQSGAKNIRHLVDEKIISVHDYSYNDFGLEKLTGGYFANLLGTIKHGTSFPLFDNISTDIVRAVINNEIIDFGKIDKEIIRHAGIANNILSTLPTLEKASVDEILDFKNEMRVPLDNFRKAIFDFSQKITSMPWDDDFQYECLKLYDTEVLPKINEINALSSETSVLKNFGSKILADEEERRKLGYVGAGLITTITTGSNIAGALGILENLIQTGSKIGLTAASVTAFLKTVDLLNRANEDVKEKKSLIENNVMYYYYKASKKI